MFSQWVGVKESEKEATHLASHVESVIGHFGRNRRSVRVMMLDGRPADLRVEVVIFL